VLFEPAIALRRLSKQRALIGQTAVKIGKRSFEKYREKVVFMQLDIKINFADQF